MVKDADYVIVLDEGRIWSKVRPITSSRRKAGSQALPRSRPEHHGVAEQQPKPVHRKDAKGAKENQNLNHKGTRRENQGHEVKSKDSFAESKS